jgi:Cellulose biosynthesis protein BcsS
MSQRHHLEPDDPSNRLRGNSIGLRMAFQLWYQSPSSMFAADAEGYRHLRLGSHINSMKAENTEWSAAAGWAQDSQGRASPFLRLNMLKRL